jgi:hypothetical protein
LYNIGNVSDSLPREVLLSRPIVGTDVTLDEIRIKRLV